MKILWIFLGGHHRNWTSLRVISMQFRVFFLRSRYRIGIFFGVAKVSNIIFRVLEIPDIFLG